MGLRYVRSTYSRWNRYSQDGDICGCYDDIEKVADGEDCWRLAQSMLLGNISVQWVNIV